MEDKSPSHSQSCFYHGTKEFYYRDYDSIGCDVYTYTFINIWVGSVTCYGEDKVDMGFTYVDK